MRNPKELPPPPFVTEESTPRQLFTALTGLANWCLALEECFTPDSLALVDQQSPRPDLPEFEMMAAVSVWQAYRTLRTVRAVRIGYDFTLREYGDNPTLFSRHMYKLLAAGRSVVRFAFTTPAEFRAHHATRDAYRVQQFIDGQRGDQGEQSGEQA